MKRVKLLMAMFAAVAIMASCTTTQYASDDLDETTTRRIGNRVYVDDPFYGQVVLERDPFTGRYYDVTYGNRGFASPYNSWNYRGYRNNYVRPPYRGSNPSLPRNYNIQRPSQEKLQQSREETRNKVLGN